MAASNVTLYDVIAEVAAYIEINDVLNLSLLNTSAHKVMKQYISYNVWFKIDGRSKDGFQLKHYSPVRLEIHGRYLLSFILEPSLITHIWTSSTDIDEIINELPRFPRLSSIHFGEHFSYSLSSFPPLPPQIKHLTLPRSFKQPLNSSVLPSSLLSLTLLGSYFYSLNDLPPTLQHLSLQFVEQVPLSFPPLLKSLSLSCLSIQSLPPSLTHLFLEVNLYHNFNSGAPLLLYPLTKTTKGFPPLPSSIKSITFGNNFNIAFNEGDFPSSLTHLSFGPDYYSKLPPLPSSLVFLSLPLRYPHHVEVREGVRVVRV